MSKKKSFFLSLSICCILILTSMLFIKNGISAKPVSNNISFEELDAYIEKHINRLNIPGVALAIVEDNKIVHLRGFGQARPGGETPSPLTPFIIGSVTKSFTALAIMQLVESGKIKLDFPVQSYLPWFRIADPKASAQITVRHLLNQTSGLPLSCGRIPLVDFENKPGACEHYARAIATLKLTRPVGSAFEYCNMNYNLLGLIIEAVSSESYEVYVQNHIFVPLGMKHSYTSQSLAKENGLAVGNRYWFASPFAIPDMPIARASFPSAYLITSSEDLAHYLIAYLNKGRYGNIQILSPAGIDELHHPAVPANIGGVPMGQYGMGWFIQEINRTKIIWHNGLIPGFISYIALLPEQKKGVVLLINAEHLLLSPVITEIGMGAATWLATGQFAPTRLGFIPWLLRGLLIIPLLQIISIAVTLRLIRRWRKGLKNRPSSVRKWVRYILLPLIINLLVAFLMILSLLVNGSISSGLLFTPDITWIAMICGGFSLVWGFLHTWLILRALRTRP
jgi:CubicO group peptidase (beta-lactamase class C family)